MGLRHCQAVRLRKIADGLIILLRRAELRGEFVRREVAMVIRAGRIRISRRKQICQDSRGSATEGRWRGQVLCSRRADPSPALRHNRRHMAVQLHRCRNPPRKPPRRTKPSGPSNKLFPIKFIKLVVFMAVKGSWTAGIARGLSCPTRSGEMRQRIGRRVVKRRVTWLMAFPPRRAP